MRIRATSFAVMAAAAALSGCGWLPDAYTGCDEARPYQAAKDAGPLRVPAGADLPDTRNALKIPDLEKPELPRESGSCLEHPPPSGGESTQPAQG